MHFTSVLRTLVIPQDVIDWLRNEAKIGASIFGCSMLRPGDMAFAFWRGV